ncbi:MAG TPA: efflux RND transporter periplasmic adaptor subunit, partial [Bacteroidota bacterium]|nr:efflux RND transporter periplasmic adaptor subunit [Bacteroidota bacterium]
MQKQAQAALDQTIVNLRFAVIRSPIDGVVISRDVDVGQTVAASFQTPKLFTIAKDLTQMEVQASVDEADIGQIKVGERVAFTVEAYPDENFYGSVSQIRLQPLVVQNVVTYTVVIEAPNPELKLRPGMTATVSILIDQHRNILRVPAIALRFQPPQDNTTKPDQSQQSTQSANSQSGQPTQGGGQPSTTQTGQQPGGPGGGFQGQRGMNRGGRDSSGKGNGNPGWQTEGQAAPKTGRVWILQPDNTIQVVTITLGLNDNRYVEVLSGDVKEGDDIVLGIIGVETASGGGQTQTNPFAPQRFGGPGGPGGGGGRPGGGGR